MPRVLVIDDQKDVRTVMRMVLKVHRFDVVEAESASAGLRAFAEGAFDVVLVDIFLEDASGLDVIARIRAVAPAQPVVVVSGMTSVEAAAGELLGDIVWLQKPFRPAELIAAVSKAQSLSCESPGPQRVAV